MQGAAEGLAIEYDTHNVSFQVGRYIKGTGFSDSGTEERLRVCMAKGAASLIIDYPTTDFSDTGMFL